MREIPGAPAASWPAMDEHVTQHTARARLLDGAAVEERRLEVGGVQTHLASGGDGPPLVFLHGGSQAGGVLWARVLPRLVRTHRVVAPDLPGLGESAPLPRLDADAFGRWLAAVLAVTVEEPPTLVAHSLPGNLAARFAAAHPQALRRLVLVAAPTLEDLRPPPGLLVAAMGLNLRPSPRNLERFARWPYLDRQRTGAELGAWHDALDAYLLARAGVRHVKRTMRQIVGAGRRGISASDLHAITTPVELLWGRGDRMVPVSIGQAASSTLGWRLQVIDGAGHLPHVERPEAFVDALEGTLDRG